MSQPNRLKLKKKSPETQPPKRADSEVDDKKVDDEEVDDEEVDDDEVDDDEVDDVEVDGVALDPATYLIRQQQLANYQILSHFFAVQNHSITEVLIGILNVLDRLNQTLEKQTHTPNTGSK